MIWKSQSLKNYENDNRQLQIWQKLKHWNQQGTQTMLKPANSGWEHLWKMPIVQLCNLGI